MKKRTLSILLTLFMVLYLVPTSVFAEGETNRKVETEQELVDALSDGSVDIIKLKNDIAISTTLTVDRNVTLDLVGYMLEISGSGSVIKVKRGGHLTLKDSDPTSTYKFTPDANGLWKWGTAGTKTVNGGVIYGGNAGYGGGVYIEPGGQLTMNGGSIVGCYANSGGGVKVDCDETKGSKFTMNSGAIIGCVAKGDGGGVETQANAGNELHGAFIMNGGVIEYCVGENYGGVLCSGTFTMNGGTIQYCRATEETDPAEQRGGIFLSGRGRNIINGTIISGDVVDTQHIFVNGPVTIGANADIRANMYSYGYTIALADGVTYKTIYGKITNVRYADGLAAVTYQVNGGDYATQIVRSGSTATKPDTPSKIGHSFDGWYTSDGTKWDFNTAVTENITLIGSLYIPVMSETELRAALADDTADIVRLTKDIDISSSLTILRKVTLDLNGYVLKMTGSGSVIILDDNNGTTTGNLTLIDSNSTAEHKFKVNGVEPWELDDSGTETVRGGVITGGTGLTDSDNNGYGGGVYVAENGTFTMTGGNIVGCTATGDNAFGGGVFVSKNGTFTMTGGSITGCTAVANEYGFAYGGGVRNDGEWRGDIGRTTLSGTAVIRDCHAKGCEYNLYGGGVSDAGTLTISGDVKIIGCTAGGYGSDAMYVNANNSSSVTGGTFYGSIKDLGNKIHGLTVTYRLNSNENYATQVLQPGDQITLPDPAKPGYTFDGWYRDGTKWDSTTLVNENLTLTGWLYAPVTDESTLTAALADSSIDVIRLTSDIKLSNELQITNNRKVTLDLGGYILDLGGKHILVSALSGDPWYHSNQLTIIDSDPSKPHKFTDNDGLWKPEENGDKTVYGGIITGGSSAITVGSRGTVTMNGGNIVGCSADSSGGAVSALNGTFIMTGGSIIGCKTDFAGGAVYVLNGKFIMNSGSITNCVVTSPAGDGGAVYVSVNSTFTMTGGSIADCTAVNGSALYLKNGTMNAGGGTVGGTVVLERNITIQGSDCTFSGLIINNDAQTQFSGAHSPLGIVGKEPIGAIGYSYHKVAFDTAGGNMSHTTRYFLQGKDISNEIKPDPRTGYIFTGWYKADGTAWDFASDKVTDNTILYAKWTANTYTVTFDSTGGSEVITKTIDVTYDEPLGDMPVPKREGYVFLGWYDALTGGKCYGGSDGKSTSPYDKDVSITLYAQWAEAPSRMVYFDTYGGTMSGPVEVLHKLNTPIAKPDNPTKSGYSFNGWYTDISFTQAWNFDDWVTGQLRLYAGWTINQYTITFDTAGGSEIAPITQDYGTSISAPAYPTRNGYDFKDWDKEIPETMPAENITLKARWRDIEKPTGEIIIGTNKWREFLNKLTFGLFFKDTQEVTINAADNSGTVFVSYLVTDQDLTEAELQSLVFGGYDEPFCIDPNGEYIVYVMLVDESMNITYLRSDRITLDNNQPVISGIEDGKTYCKALTITIEEKYVDTVTVNGAAVTLDEAGSFTLAPANGEQKIIVTDKAGNTAEMTVTVNDWHTGGTATCTERAVCKICGAEYGELDPKNHTDLKHIPARAATKTAEGNIEYWYCESYGKYFSDADATKEITLAATVTTKLPDDAKSPQTGDPSNLMLWIALLFISGGAVIGSTVLSKKSQKLTK